MTEFTQSIREGKLNVCTTKSIYPLATSLGFESLARWQRDDGSFVTRFEIYAIAENQFLIISHSIVLIF